MVTYSLDDVQRSLPSALDGLKESQRKVVFACHKENLTHSKPAIKVSEMAGMVSKESEYHHGEASLMATITQLANSFPGSNQLPLLEGVGTFGTRRQNGHDCGSPRYVQARLSRAGESALCLDKDTLATLSHNTADGKEVEPRHYIPLLPMALVNGSRGIASGFSCFVPQYAIGDVASALICVARGGACPSLCPKPHGFSGSIENLGAGKFRSWGVVDWLDERTLHVSELPIGSGDPPSLEGFKEHLKGLMDAGKIANFDHKMSDVNKADFRIHLTEEQAQKADQVGLEAYIGQLTKSFNTNNMHMLDENGALGN